MRNTLFALSMFLPIHDIAAQEAGPKLISTAGQQIRSTSGSISFSIGEPVVGSFGNQSLTVSQGFHQGDASQACTIGGFNPFSPNLYSRLDSLPLDAGAGFTKYAWSTGATGQSISVKYSGSYHVTVTNASGCTASDSVFVQFPDTVGILMPAVSATCSGHVDVPVRTTSFRNMLTMQGSINWNAADLRFDSIAHFGPAKLSLNNTNFGGNQASAGRLAYSWNDANDIGVTLQDTTTLFIIRFTVLTNAVKTVPVTFANNPTLTEFTDGRLVKKTVNLTQGAVSVNCELTMTGKVLTPLNSGVRNIRVTLSGESGSQTAVTDSAGNYSFKMLPGTYTLTPSKTFEQNKTNGVSTLDIALIQSHILFKKPFDAAYKVIAGDANNSSSITTADIIDLRRLILGTDTTLPNNRLWTFVDGDQAFNNLSNPFPFNATKTFNNLSANTSHTFRGIKLGDVNYDRNPLLDQAPSGDTLRLYYDWIDTQDDHILLRLKTQAVTGIMGYQTSLKWDADKLTLDGILANPTGIGFGERWKNEGFLNLSWNDPLSRGLSFTDGMLLLEVRFRKTSRLDRTALRLDEEKLATEAFNADFQGVGVRLTPTEIKDDDWKGQLRVFPNPAGREVNIEWRNEKKGQVTIRLLDALGRVAYVHRGYYEAGLQRHLVHRDLAETGAGSYIVQVESGGRMLNGTVVMVDRAPSP